MKCCLYNINDMLSVLNVIRSNSAVTFDDMLSALKVKRSNSAMTFNDMLSALKVIRSNSAMTFNHIVCFAFYVKHCSNCDFRSFVNTIATVFCVRFCSNLVASSMLREKPGLISIICHFCKTGKMVS